MKKYLRIDEWLRCVFTSHNDNLAFFKKSIGEFNPPWSLPGQKVRILTYVSEHPPRKIYQINLNIEAVPFIYNKHTINFLCRLIINHKFSYAMINTFKMPSLYSIISSLFSEPIFNKASSWNHFITSTHSSKLCY